MQKLRHWSTALGCSGWLQFRWQCNGKLTKRSNEYIDWTTASQLIPSTTSATDLLLKTEPCKKILKLEPLSQRKVAQYYLWAQRLCRDTVCWNKNSAINFTCNSLGKEKVKQSWSWINESAIAGGGEQATDGNKAGCHESTSGSVYTGGFIS